ncbi:MAG TPA: nitroreductase/quinone reductase family protein [Anaerolineales bacterium]|jgi:deazaflavin-dependent oxidoreductase (nitroreductase family)|nr:nitroreductase/quinone reductase family protein [Anaerolineales bacterium]
MAKTFRISTARRLEGRLMNLFIRRGLAPPTMHVLSVRGRKTGLIRSNPIDHVLLGDDMWLVAPYREVQWVRNARAAGQVALSRGGRSESVRIVEASPAETAPVLRASIARDKYPRPYIDVGPDSPVEAFIAEAPRHPVFRVLSQAGSAAVE